MVARHQVSAQLKGPPSHLVSGRRCSRSRPDHLARHRPGQAGQARVAASLWRSTCYPWPWLSSVGPTAEGLISRTGKWTKLPFPDRAMRSCADDPDRDVGVDDGQESGAGTATQRR